MTTYTVVIVREYDRIIDYHTEQVKAYSAEEARHKSTVNDWIVVAVFKGNQVPL